MSPASRSSCVSPTQAMTPRPACERGLRAARDAGVGLAEVLAPLRVADERAADAELEQHRRRDLTRVRALVLPVDVLRERRQARLDAACERDERRADDRVDTGRRRASRPASATGSGPENIFQLPATITSSLDADGIAATPGSSLPSSSSRLAPPPVETQEIVVGEAELVQRAHRVGAADDGERLLVRGDRLRDGLRALGEARPLEHAHRPVPEDRARLGDDAAEPLARLRPDVEPEPAVGQILDRVDPRLRVLGELGGADDVARQLDREVERVLDAHLLGHLAADQHGVRATAEVLQHAELVVDLRAARDRTNGRSTSPSSLPRCSSSSSSSRPAYAGSRCATPSVDACARCAEPNASFT